MVSFLTFPISEFRINTVKKCHYQLNNFFFSFGLSYRYTIESILYPSSCRLYSIDSTYGSSMTRYLLREYLDASSNPGRYRWFLLGDTTGKPLCLLVWYDFKDRSFSRAYVFMSLFRYAGYGRLTQWSRGLRSPPPPPRATASRTSRVSTRVSVSTTENSVNWEALWTMVILMRR